MKRHSLSILAAAALCACGSLSADSEDVGQLRSRLLDSSAIVGDWSGTSIDKAGVAGVVTATFTQLSPSTFSGSMHAFFPDFGASADCNISGGQLTTDGAVQMPSQCSFEGFQGVSGSLIEGQLSADGQTLNTTFRGPARDSGSITLTRNP